MGVNRIAKSIIFFIQVISGQTVVDDYVYEGLKNNIVLQQKKISYERAVYSLRSATSLFFPSVQLEASYVSGDGGRSIDIPVGDLLNPVYQTLNQLTGTNSFPQIQNVSENLFPDDFYDVKLRTTMPI
nr:TolC family protein [Ignavibacteriaceae bacterium]